MLSFKIRTRIAILAAVPLVGVVFAAGQIAAEKRSVYEEMRTVADIVALDADISTYVHSLQAEAGASAALVGSRGSEGRSGLAVLRQTTDTSRNKVQERLKGIDVAAISPELSKVLQEGLRSASQPDPVRASVDSLKITPNEMNNFYTASIGQLLEFSRYATKSVRNPDVSREMQVYSNLLWMAEFSSAARANAAVGFQQGKFDIDLYNRVQSFHGRQQGAESAIAFYATAEERNVLATVYSGTPVDETNRMLRVMYDAGPGGDVQSVSLKAWLDTNAQRMQLLSRVEVQFEQNLKDASSRAERDAYDKYLTSIGLAAALVGATIVLVVMITRGITVPIRRLSDTMSALADGNTSVEVGGTDRADEIGAMARTVEVFRASLSDAERMRAERADQDRVAGERIRVERNNLADKFQASMVALADSFVKSSGDVADAARNLSTTAEEATRKSHVVAGAAGEASDSVTTVATGTEELNASIREIGAQVTKSAEIAADAASEAVRTETNVRALTEAAEKIGEVLNLIRDIASQTNLLALNATIEAARAGEAGRGFAVVASEVKQLAAQTAKATDVIGEKITEIQSATGDTVSSIGRIVTTIATIREVTSSIAGAVEEQGAATNEIAHSTQRAAHGAQAVTGNIAAVGEAAAMTGAAASQLMSHSQQLREQSGELQREVVAFIAGLRA
ncbi:methyl-accepting chemotaxis protein [Bradyrhizobium sp. UFLA05-112]